MQRKAYAPGRSGSAVLSAAALALGLGIGLTGCSSGAAVDTEAVDSKAGPAAPAAPPGRYRTLFEPCGAVPAATLKDLLPGAATLPEAERARVYRGVSAATFDTDRRVGCSWRADGPDAVHRLTLDVERVVSYDPVVSDDARAQEVYGRKQSAAGVAPVSPVTTPPPSSPPAGTTGTAGAAGTTGPGGSKAPSSSVPSTAPGAPPVGHEPAQALQGPQGSQAPRVPEATASTAPTAPASTPATGLESRVLEGLGDIAFLDDTLESIGPSGGKRLVSVVFRTSNVIVTVQYEEQTVSPAVVPDSKELQEKARNLARLLADRLEE
ncbi:DUF3558 domain-containing protein [Streptomyces sp. NPDC126499]|uniref:DUF3558 domain-containing protein n=1 Tax=Streptomyces sp. NPDC126499 TaxID=3155314 RepID=UPI0033247F79